MTVTAYCHTQRAIISRELELVKLRDRFSQEAPAMTDDLIPKLKVGLIYSSDTSPNADGKAKGS
ncbi:hypothetical protein [Mesorhizobium sp. M0579]|uniref:hypothetical protein n=1 Tax=Mesorhizobium sp. M0579 TaxID=2956962 RepID=UPI00333C102B